LIGRAQEIDAALHLLRQPRVRLLTLTASAPFITACGLPISITLNDDAGFNARPRWPPV
jgi:hypothetical protein